MLGDKITTHKPLHNHYFIKSAVSKLGKESSDAMHVSFLFYNALSEKNK